MRKRKFEAVLEECLQAQLESRRTLEESLSLYPSLATQLEPLLRAAAQIEEAFQSSAASPHAEDQIRLRFLAAASDRNRARALTDRIKSPHTLGPWSLRRWSVLGAAAAVGAALAVMAGVILAGGGNGGGDNGGAQVARPTASGASEFVLNLAEARSQIAMISRKAHQGERIAPSEIAALAHVTSKLAQTGDPAANPDGRDDVAKVVQDQVALLQELSTNPPAGAGEQVQNAVGAAQTLADQWDIPLSPPTASPAAASPTPSEQPSPTSTPPPTAPATPTATPSPAAGTTTPTPVPSETPATTPERLP